MPATIDKYTFAVAFGLTPLEAIKFLEKKGYKFTWSWREQIKLNHAQAFTVAKAMRMDILQDIRAMLHKALDVGLTYKQFQKTLTPTLQSKGWWGRKIVRGESVMLGSPHRLRTIYKTNMQSAFSSGRWEAMWKNQNNRPYLQYIAIDDGVTRQHHFALNGQIRAITDSFWDIYYPPNGYNCRCRARPLNRRQAENKVSKDIPTDAKGKKILPDEGFDRNIGKQHMAWQPDVADYDKDIWHAGESLKYNPIVLPNTNGNNTSKKEGNK